MMSKLNTSSLLSSSPHPDINLPHVLFRYFKYQIKDSFMFESKLTCSDKEAAIWNDKTHNKHPRCLPFHAAIFIRNQVLTLEWLSPLLSMIHEDIDVRRFVENTKEKSKCKQEILSSSYESLAWCYLWLFFFAVPSGRLSDLSSMSYFSFKRMLNFRNIVSF